MKTQDMTIEEWEAAKKRLPAKYKNVKVEIDGYLFDSESEGRRYQELKLLEKAGEIDGLELQPKYPVSVRGKHVCFYSADFRYWDYKTGAFIIEDVKGVKTAVYRLKKKLVEANYGIEIVEISA